jgi:hypothetical protein
MRCIAESPKEPVTGGRLASSAQPPRATSALTHRFLARQTPQPFPSAPFLDTPGALLEGLRCFPAVRPLPARDSCQEQTSEGLGAKL